jgi:hypothetical protein
LNQPLRDRSRLRRVRSGAFECDHMKQEIAMRDLVLPEPAQAAE